MTSRHDGGVASSAAARSRPVIITVATRMYMCPPAGSSCTCNGADAVPAAGSKYDAQRKRRIPPTHKLGHCAGMRHLIALLVLDKTGSHEHGYGRLRKLACMAHRGARLIQELLRVIKNPHYVVVAAVHRDTRRPSGPPGNRETGDA